MIVARPANNAPRVVQSIAQKLRSLVDAHTDKLGVTPTGRDWCIKALHPSDPLTEVRGIPDSSSVPSLLMNYQTVATISPQNGATGTWEVDLQLLPHPVGFASYIQNDSVGTLTAEIMNSQLTPPTHSGKYEEFADEFKRWRLAYCSVTIYQDGPDLANQGTVVAAQKPVQPLNLSPNGAQELNNMGAAMPSNAVPHTLFLVNTDLPNYDASQGMPNAYFGRSKEGVYMPLKLTRSHQQWVSGADAVYQSNGSMLNGGTLQKGQITMRHTTGIGGPPSITGVYPFTTLEECRWHTNSTALTTMLCGEPTSPYCNDSWGDISFRNLSVQTSLSLFFRLGFECQVQPNSPLAPHMKLSPPEDILAVSAYHAISREFKDAYPADFNDLGKIWDVISRAAKTISPIIGGAIPGVGPMIAGGINAAAAIGDGIRAQIAAKAQEKLKRRAAAGKKGGENRGNTRSAADREKAIVKQAVAEALESAPRKLEIKRPQAAPRRK